jgi:hypothetical protein
MVASRQRPSWSEANFFREVLHRPWGGARACQPVVQECQFVRAGRRDGGGGGERRHHEVFKLVDKQEKSSCVDRVVYFRFLFIF